MVMVVVSEPLSILTIWIIVAWNFMFFSVCLNNIIGSSVVRIRACETRAIFLKIYCTCHFTFKLGLGGCCCRCLWRLCCEVGRGFRGFLVFIQSGRLCSPRSLSWLAGKRLRMVEQLDMLLLLVLFLLVLMTCLLLRLWLLLLWHRVCLSTIWGRLMLLFCTHIDSRCLWLCSYCLLICSSRFTVIIQIASRWGLLVS